MIENDGVPEFLEEYEECDDCSVKLRGPRIPNSPHGYHTELCDYHADINRNEEGK